MTRISILNLEATKSKIVPVGANKPGAPAATGVIYNLGGAINIDPYTAWNFGSTLPFVVQSLQVITALNSDFTKGVVDHGIFNLDIDSNRNPAQLLAVSPTPAQFIKLTNLVGDEDCIGDEICADIDTAPHRVYPVQHISLPDSPLRDYAVNLYASLSGGTRLLSISV